VSRPRHLTVGWCWSVGDVDVGWPEWGIYGHVSEDEASQIVDAYEGESVGPVLVEHDYRRSVPCRQQWENDCSGTPLCPAPGPGRGAGPYTWVTRRES